MFPARRVRVCKYISKFACVTATLGLLFSTMAGALLFADDSGTKDNASTSAKDGASKDGNSKDGTIKDMPQKII